MQEFNHEGGNGNGWVGGWLYFLIYFQVLFK